MSARQDSDDLARDRKDELYAEAITQVRLSSRCEKIVLFASKRIGRPVTLVPPLMIGGYNVLYLIRLEGASDSILVRLPAPSQFVFPEEKTLVEAATAACIAQLTECLVPKLFHYGVNVDIGPYIIIQDLGARRCMSDALERPREDMDETPVLNPEIPESKLFCLYGRMAKCMLQLAQATFPRIGALIETSPGSYDEWERREGLELIDRHDENSC